MTDREMLLLAFGAMKVLESSEPQLQQVVELIQDHLYPPRIIVEDEHLDDRAT